MRPSVCFETGRFTLTQSSRTALDHRSRKWMSGPAGARASTRDRRLQFTSFFYRTLREPLSEGKPPFSLDLYLSWMFPYFGKAKVEGTEPASADGTTCYPMQRFVSGHALRRAADGSTREPGFSRCGKPRRTWGQGRLPVFRSGWDIRPTSRSSAWGRVARPLRFRFSLPIRDCGYPALAFFACKGGQETAGGDSLFVMFS